MVRKGDVILIVFIIAVIVISYGWKVLAFGNSNAQGIATIQIDGKLYGRYDLKSEGNKVIELKLPGDESSAAEFNDGRVRIKDANCPDKICVKTGWISKPGEMIVCLPYRIIIKISGDSENVDVNAF